MENELGVAFEFVQLPNGLVMGKYPVTQAQWELVMGFNPSEFKGPNKPVERVSWNDTQDFCQKLSEITGDFFVLPTSEEWEYACRAGSTSKFSFGDDEDQLGEYGWYWLNSNSTTHPVGEKKPNPWGLYDMHGNVWEWTASGKNAQKQDVLGGEWFEKLPFHFISGGSWFNNAVNCRSAYRGRFVPGDRGSHVGFRLMQGGSWFNDGVDCRSADRLRNTPNDRHCDVGFRLIRGGSWNDIAVHCRSEYLFRNAPNDRSHVVGFRLMHGGSYIGHGCHSDCKIPNPEEAQVSSLGFRIIRSGSWVNDAKYCRSANRRGYTQDFSDGDIGFRLIRGGSWIAGAEYCSSEYCYKNTPGNHGYDAGFRIVKL